MLSAVPESGVAWGPACGCRRDCVPSPSACGCRRAVLASFGTALRVTSGSTGESCPALALGYPYQLEPSWQRRTGAHPSTLKPQP